MTEVDFRAGNVTKAIRLYKQSRRERVKSDPLKTRRVQRILARAYKAHRKLTPDEWKLTYDVFHPLPVIFEHNPKSALKRKSGRPEDYAARIVVRTLAELYRACGGKVSSAEGADFVRFVEEVNADAQLRLRSVRDTIRRALTS